MDYESEINDLKRRVGDLEGAISVITGQLRLVHPELLTLKRQTSERFDAVDTAMSRMVGRLDTMNTQVWSLRDDLPTIVGEAVRKSTGRTGN